MRVRSAVLETAGRFAFAIDRSRTHGSDTRAQLDQIIRESKDISQTNPGRARFLLSRAVAQARARTYLPELSAALMRMAWLDVASGDMALALLRASEASFVVNISKPEEWPAAYGAQFVVNYVYGQVGCYSEAEAGWHRLLDLTHLHSDELRRADVLDEMGTLRMLQGRLTDALNLRHNALVILERHDDPGALNVLSNIAELHLLMGQPSEALLSATNTLPRVPANAPVISATLLLTMAMAHLKRSALTTASELLEQGSRLVSSGGHLRQHEVGFTLGLGMLASAKRDIGSAQNLLLRALHKAERWQLVTSQVDALEALSKAHQQAGDAKMAHHYAAQHAALVQKLGIERNKLQVRVTKVEPVVADLRAQWLTKLRFA